MKTETVIKVLKRYAKGLDAMYEEAKASNDPAAEHYRFDRAALINAISIIEDRKE